MSCECLSRIVIEIVFAVKFCWHRRSRRRRRSKYLLVPPNEKSPVMRRAKGEENVKEKRHNGKRVSTALYIKIHKKKETKSKNSTRKKNEENSNY